MQTLRKKTSPLKFKNETTRFLGDGVSFKAKLIGILEVSEARGDRMCQEALCDLKMAIRAAGEHKQRITVNIAIDGLRLRDEKTGDCLYHHPVHKISFIAQDMTDSRAFGYIFGSPDTGHRFFGIKTDKAASQVVIAMRDLFQVVFALKKKEIELAKQHLEKSYLPTSPLFSDSPNSTSKVRRKKTWPTEKSKTEPKGTASTSENKNSGTAVADLVDLELELNSLQQGLNQMERITPSDPFGSKDDPFGDSFISYPINKLILPPPPSSGRERLSRTSEASSTRTPPNTSASIDSASDSLFSSKSNKEFSFSRDLNSSHDEPSSGDWFNPSFGNSIFEEPPSTVSAAEPTSKDEKHEAAKQEIMSQFDVFTELDPLGESWAIFDQPSVPSEVKENLGAAQSEEGVSPWSSDSKEFGNRSPTNWKKEKSGERKKKNREQEDWWDTTADPEGQYYPSNRRSTDSYDEEYYECYDRPRRRRQGGWQHGSQQGTGGHSSSSRDVSPWEEEPRRREGRPGWTGRHPRGHSFDRHRDVKHVDSWDDEDDYEYDEEHRSRGHYLKRHGSKDSERHSTAGSRELENDRWDDYGSERRYRRRREGARDSKETKDRWCCPDWEQGEHDKTGRYASRRSNMTERRERYDERYRSSRESQDSPWEDEYSNEPDESHSPHYLAAKKNWKQRPNSASEMDRKTGEIKSRHYLGTGGSDGERDRRYKGARRSRSRDSQFSEPSHRHKAEVSASRSQHRAKPHKAVESDYMEMASKKIPPDVEATNKKLPGGRKKPAKENLVATAEPMANTFPRKGSNRSKSLFDNDFVPSDESPIIRDTGSKFTFENDFDKQEAESHVVNRSLKGLRQQSMFDKTSMRLEKSFKDRRSESFQESKLSPRYPPKPRSPFEDDFSPSEKSDAPEGNGISSIKEEPDLAEEEEDSFGATSLNIPPNNRKKILNNKSRLSSCRTDVNLKKSGSVNIFARENDPFDDDFFSCGNNGQGSEQRSTELRWTEEFEDSDSGRK